MTTKIGAFMGLDVIVDEKVTPGTIEFRNGGRVLMRFSVDHPYIHGTALERAARTAIAEKAQ